MSDIEKLYNNLAFVTDDYADTEETKEARHNVENALGKKAYLKYEDKIAILEGAVEKQAFIFGFQYAVSLLTGGKAVAINE